MTVKKSHRSLFFGFEGQLIEVRLLDVMFIVLLVWTCIFVALVMWSSLFVGLSVCICLLICYKWDWIKEEVKNVQRV